MTINLNKTLCSNLWLLTLPLNIKTCFMGIFFIFGTTQAKPTNHLTALKRNTFHSCVLGYSRIQFPSLFTFSPTATTSHNTNTEHAWPGLLSNSCPALVSHRNPQWLCKSVIITIVTNEFPKRFGNVKNLIKIICRVMRMPPPQSFILHSASAQQGQHCGLICETSWTIWGRAVCWGW